MAQEKEYGNGMKNGKGRRGPLQNWHGLPGA